MLLLLKTRVLLLVLTWQLTTASNSNSRIFLSSEPLRHPHLHVRVNTHTNTPHTHSHTPTPTLKNKSFKNPHEPREGGALTQPSPWTLLPMWKRWPLRRKLLVRKSGGNTLLPVNTLGFIMCALGDYLMHVSLWPPSLWIYKHPINTTISFFAGPQDPTQLRCRPSNVQQLNSISTSSMYSQKLFSRFPRSTSLFLTQLSSLSLLLDLRIPARILIFTLH